MNGIKTALFIAYKSIVRGSKSTMFLLIFILFLTFINMMFITGILNGFGELIPQMFIEDVSAHITVSPQEKPRVKQYILGQAKLRQQLLDINGVLATARRYNLAGTIAFDKNKDGQFKRLSAPVIGIDPEQDAKVMSVFSKMQFGEFLVAEDTDKIILSSALAGGYGRVAPNDLGGVLVGDKVRITYDDGMVRMYTVKGIYDDNMNMNLNFVTVKDAETMLNVFDDASQILVKLKPDAGPVERYVKEIKKIAPSLKIQTYKEALGGYGAFLKALKLIALIITIISIIVAAVTIFILIYVNALNKRKQIGILKAIGIKQSTIVVSYMFQSLFYTIISIMLGIVIVFGVLYPIFLKYPINVDFGRISLVFTLVGSVVGIGSFAIAGIIAGIIPSRIVAKQEILKAIWG